MNCKYLHIMHNGNKVVTNNYIDLINTYFKAEEHLFVLIAPELDDRIRKYSNIVNLKKYCFKDLLRLIRQSKYVFLHAMWLSTYTKLRLMLMPKQMCKIVWIAWGMDLYEDNTRNFFKEYINEAFKKRIKNFIGIFKPDINLFREKYGERAKAFYAPYGSMNRNHLYSEEPDVIKLSEKKKTGKTINILIGHQANKLLGHMSVIDFISAFKEENIKVIIPLSYGDEAYADRVEKYAISMLGDKAYIIREYMDYEDYLKVLSDVDIAIFDVQRQIGLGNITPLLYMQKKMYLNGVMYEHYRSLGINVCNFEDIRGYDDFTADVDMANATVLLRKYTSVEYTVEQWKKVFESIR